MTEAQGVDGDEVAGLPIMGDMHGACDSADRDQSDAVVDIDSGVSAVEKDFLDMRLEDLIDDQHICERVRALLKTRIETVKDVPALWSTVPYWGLKQRRQHESVNGYAQAVNQAAGRAIDVRRAKFRAYEVVDTNDKEQVEKICLDNIDLGLQITEAIQPVINRCRTLMDALFASLTQE